MPQNLVVQQGTRVLLNDNPAQALAGALQRIQINNLQDLVDAEVVRSRQALDQLLDSAKEATSGAIRSRNTFTPPMFVPGTALPDLRRFSAFRAGAPEVASADASIFWRVVRDVEPAAISDLSANADLSKLLVPNRFREILKYLFADVDVQANAVLTIAPTVHVFGCGNLVIHTTGKIVVQGSGVVIRATSIRGNA